MADDGKTLYQLGWDEGWIEGYECKIADMTETFMPAGTPAEIEAAAVWLQQKYAAAFTKGEAIGVARGMIAALRGERP